MRGRGGGCELIALDDYLFIYFMHPNMERNEGTIRDNVETISICLDGQQYTGVAHTHHVY